MKEFSSYLPQEFTCLGEIESVFVEEFMLSGGGQGNAPKPPPKIQGGQHNQRTEKIKSYPKLLPQPRPSQRPR